LFVSRRSKQPFAGAADPDQLIGVDRLALDDLFLHPFDSELQRGGLPDQAALGLAQFASELGRIGIDKNTETARRTRTEVKALE
jgi:hypothetical protein